MTQAIHPHFAPSRQAGLDRLKHFASKAGRAYADGRNIDTGLADTQSVSLLSPYLRRRMVTEREVVQAVLAHHDPQSAEKFIQEVFWRTYWKGWLEMRPAIWERYCRDCDAAQRDPPTLYDQAIAGTTGIDGFDHWARELVQTGYLHNHARMWFASIWIFTLRLPWALGADFFYRHLLDADPASNTLSWRWVAGLHTKGKTYLARPDNIEKHTNGRFRPSGLASHAHPLQEDELLPDPIPPRQAENHVPTGSYALILTNDDLHPESWPGYEANPPKLVIAVTQTKDDATRNNGSVARGFNETSVHEAVSRLSCTQTHASTDPNDIVDHMRDKGLALSVLPFACSGPNRPFRDKLKTCVESTGGTLFEIKRPWDDAAWPLATAGFFKLKKSIPRLLAQANLTQA